MKFDMDLARQILLKLQEDDDADGSHGVVIEIPGKSDRTISYHIARLNEAGLLVGLDASSCDGIEWMATSLTITGHDFITMFQKDTFWNRAKQAVADQAVPVTIGAVGAWAAEYFKKMLITP